MRGMMLGAALLAACGGGGDDDGIDAPLGVADAARFDAAQVDAPPPAFRTLADLAADADLSAIIVHEGQVIYAQLENTGLPGYVATVPVDGSSAPRPLIEAVDARGVAADATHVYVAVQGSPNDSILAVPLGGGSSATFCPSIGYGGAIFAAGGRIAWATSGGELVSVDAATPDCDNPTALGLAGPADVDGDDLVVARNLGIDRVPLDGTAATNLVKGVGATTTWLSIAGQLYWLDGAVLHRTARAGGTPDTGLTLTPSPIIAAGNDDTYLYWISEGSAYGLHRVAMEGGPMTPVAADLMGGVGTVVAATGGTAFLQVYATDGNELRAY